MIIQRSLVNVEGFQSVMGYPNWYDCSKTCEELGGISCDSYGRVTGVFLSLDQQWSKGYYALTGEIFQAFGYLQNLEYIDFKNNLFVGFIPTKILNLKSLTSLDLSDNSLQGPISPEIGNLTSLTFLNLSGNPFGGSIPSQIGNLRV